MRAICSARHPGFAGLAASGIGAVSCRPTARFSGRRDPRLRQDGVCPARRRRAAGRRHRRADHRRRADRTPQDPVGAGRRGRRHRARPEVHQLVGADVVGVPRRRRHLRAGGQPPDPAPGAHRELPHARRLRRDPPRRRREELGRGHPRGVRRRHPAPGADRHAVPQRRQPDPVRHLRTRRRRPAALAGRPHLRLRRGAGRRRRPAGRVPGLLRRGAVARQRRRGTRGTPRRTAERRADRPGLAHRAEPGRRVDARGDRGRRHPAAASCASTCPTPAA